MGDAVPRRGGGRTHTVIDKLSSRNKRTGGGERGKVEAVARL